MLESFGSLMERYHSIQTEKFGEISVAQQSGLFGVVRPCIGLKAKIYGIGLEAQGVEAQKPKANPWSCYAWPWPWTSSGLVNITDDSTTMYVPAATCNKGARRSGVARKFFQGEQI